MLIQSGDGNEGNEGNEGGWPGLVTLGGSMSFPLVSHLMPVDPNTHHPLPPDEAHPDALKFPILKVPENGYPVHSWDPMMRAQIVLGQFAATDWQQTVVLKKMFDADGLEVEIRLLVDEIDSRRQSRKDEIRTQAQGASAYFGDMLMADATSRPATWCLILCAFAVGQLVAMHFKSQFMRPRPVQIYPALLPPIPTPGHPSYPNSHALQSGLAAECVSLAHAELRPHVWALATRIAENREIAGLHYPSDKEGSWSLLPQIMPRLKQSDEFMKIVCAAIREWP